MNKVHVNPKSHDQDSLENFLLQQSANCGTRKYECPRSLHLPVQGRNSCEAPSKCLAVSDRSQYTISALR